jgi:arginase
LIIGGDCAADLVGAAMANCQAESEVALVWIDGHADLNNPSVSPSGHFHGMVVRSLMGDGPADLTRHVPQPYRPQQIFYVSARDCDPAENETIDRLSLFRLADPRAADILADEIARRGISRVYLHLDLDVLDPAVFPYVGVPAAHGLNLDELCHLLQTLRRRFHLAGAAITELNITHAGEAAAATPALRHILTDGFGLALS